MEPEVKNDNFSDVATEEVMVELNTEEPGTMSSFSAEQAREQWQNIVDRVSNFLTDLPDYLGDFFTRYKRPIITIGLVAGSIVAVKLTLAVLDSLDDIPLLSPTLELIGLGYSAWFVYRYLLRASNRRELADDFNALKEQVMGNNRS